MAKKANANRKRPRLDERFEFLSDDAEVARKSDGASAAAFPVYDRVTQTDRALRLWRKTGSPLDADLRELWLHEMRQVRRLMSSAGASEVIVDLIEMVEDDQAFGIVVEDAGQALSLLHSRAVRSHWLRNLRAGRNRTLLWDNVRRLACALGLVHAQGLDSREPVCRRRNDTGSIGPGLPINRFRVEPVVCSPTERPVLSRTSPSASLYRRQAYSFAADWAALGQLVADLLDVRLSPTGEVKAARRKTEIEVSPGKHLAQATRVSRRSGDPG